MQEEYQFRINIDKNDYDEWKKKWWQSIESISIKTESHILESERGTRCLGQFIDEILDSESNVDYIAWKVEQKILSRLTFKTQFEYCSSIKRDCSQNGFFYMFNDLPNEKKWIKKHK